MKKYSTVWKNYQKKNLEAIAYRLQHRGYDEVEKKDICLALCLWRFSRKEITDNAERRTFLKTFVGDFTYRNLATTMVAMIESLPDRVWRKLLWKENMDFMSHESFLRRITPTQAEGIQAAYHDLFGTEPRVPQVIKGLGTRIALLFKNEAKEAQKLLDEPYDDFQRNQSKGAWAFNLLGLDFGFSLYPNGNNDDRKITNQKWTRFLSVKNHINDFIVNMEFGKYWDLYRSARSNYVIRPKKVVQLKDHICPGFWMTLILHVLFWIVSPAMAIILNVHAVTDWTLWRIPFNLIALVTPLWVVIASLKLVVNTVAGLFKSITVSEQWKKRWYVVGFILLGLFVLAVGFGAVTVVVFIIKKFYLLGVIATPVIGTTLYVLSVLDLLYFIGVLIIATVKEGFHWYSDIPKFWRWITGFVAGALALRLFDVFLLKYVVQAAIWAWGAVSYAPLLTFATLAIVVFGGLAYLLLKIAETNEKTFAKLEKIIGIVGIAGIFVPLGLLAWHSDFSFTNGVPMIINVLFFVTITLIGYLFMERALINEETLASREKARYLVNENGYVLFNGKDWKTLLKSKLLMSDETVEGIFRFASEWFENYEIKRRFALSAMLAPNLPKLEQFGSVIKNITEEQDRLLFMEFIFDGLSVKQALKKVEQQNQILSKRQEKIERIKEGLMSVFDLIIDFFALIIEGCVWVYTKIKQFFLTLKDIYDLFNKYCPFVSKSTYLD